MPVKEGASQLELSRDEVLNFREIHKLPKTLPEENLSSVCLEESEVDFFRRIHKLPKPEGPAKAAIGLSEDEIEFFRRMHKLPTPIEEGREASDKLTPQEIE